MAGADDPLALVRHARDHRRAGREEEARAVYREVWQRANERGDDYAACVAAHMLGVSEPMPPDEKLRWHLASLERADRVPDGRAAQLYASIYANLGYVHAHGQRHDEAREAYRLARRHTAALDDNVYGQGLRAQIDWALGQLGVENEQPAS